MCASYSRLKNGVHYNTTQVTPNTNPNTKLRSQANCDLRERLTQCFKYPGSLFEAISILANDQKTKVAKKFLHSPSLCAVTGFFQIQSQLKEEILLHSRGAPRFADEAEKSRFVLLDVDKASEYQCLLQKSGKIEHPGLIY